MNRYLMITFAIFAFLASIIGWSLLGIAGVKMALAIFAMFFSVIWIIDYSARMPNESKEEGFI